MSWIRTACAAVAVGVLAGTGLWAFAGVTSITLDTQSAITAGTKITINGTGFGTKKPKVKLYAQDNIHGPLTITVTPPYSDTQINAVVKKPYAIAKYAGFYTVDITLADKSFVAPVQNAFQASVGQINSISPSTPAPGATVTIDGSLFGTKKGKVVVGGKPAKIVKGKWTNTQIQAVLSKKTPVGPQDMTITNTIGPAVKAVTVASAGGGGGGPRFDVTLFHDHFVAAGFTDIHTLPKGSGYEITATAKVRGTTYSVDLDLSNVDLSHPLTKPTKFEPALFEVKEVSPTATTWRATSGQAGVIVRFVSGLLRITMSIANISRVGAGAEPDPLPVRSLMVEIQFS